MFEGVKNWWENKWNNTTDAITNNAGDVLGTGAGAARIINRVANSDENEVQIAEAQRISNKAELDTDIQLIMSQYKDSFDYIADSGSFMTQNIWIPLVSFFQDMFGLETAQDKLDKHKELISEAEQRIEMAIQEHDEGLKHEYQRVMKRQLEAGADDINDGVDSIFNVEPVADPFAGAANDASTDGSIVDINQPAPQNNNGGLQFNYDGS